MGALGAISIVSAALPAVEMLATGLWSLIHHQEKTSKAMSTPGTSEVVTVPLTGAEKKQNVISDFEDKVLPFLAPLFKLFTPQFDSEGLIKGVGSVIDGIVSIMNALGVFQKSNKSVV